MLTRDQITACWEQMGRGLDKYETFARAIESAACAERDARIAGLEANEKVLLAQIQGHTKWREKIIKASEQAYGESAIRYKFSLTKNGKCMNTFPKEIDGRWFALVPAEDDGHIGHIARIAELERLRSEDRSHALDLAAEIERMTQQLQAYEKRGVTCQTFRHFVSEPCAECNSPGRCAKQLEQQLEEARKQMEAQKDEWLSWEAKRHDLEKDAERYRFASDPQSDGYAVCEWFHDGWIPINTEDLDAAIKEQT